MSSEPLKLTGDEPPAKDAGDEKPKRKRGGDEPQGARQRRRNDAELGGRLQRVFERLAEWLEGRGDTELATAIREDANAMTGGLVSLTKPIAAVRGPLLVLVAIAEPLLAFGRVARILGGRLAARRARQAAERAEQPASWAEMTEAELQVAADNGWPEAAAELERRAAGGGQGAGA